MTNEPLSFRLRRAGFTTNAYHVAVKPLTRMQLHFMIK